MSGRTAADLPVAILAGGRGTRLSGVLRDRPKPMAEVAGRPFLEWLLRYLRTLGFGRFTLCTGHMADAIEGHFGDGSWLGADIRYSREPTPLGTGGALRRALGALEGETFFAVNGDSLCGFDPGRMAKAHVGGAVVTMWLVESEDTGRFGSVSLGSDGAVEGFAEKLRGGTGLVNAGVYLMERSLLQTIPEGAALSLERDVFPSLPHGSLRGVRGSGPLQDIGTPESLAAASGFIAEHAGMFGV